MVDKAQAIELLTALTNEEATLAQAVQRLRTANTEYDLASSRFAAIRDLVTRRLGGSPYSERLRQTYAPNPRLQLDEYRFLGMNPADAALEVVRESSYPLTLDAIVERLVAGGLVWPNLLRSVNAGLMNRSGIEKDADGGYYYVPEEEDIPFD